MNFRLIFTLILLFSISKLLSQNNQDEVLMMIHDREITLGEFERIYKKNNSSSSIEQQSVDEYVDLFINFKLKVIEAEELGYDTIASFIREFTGYQKQLAKPYMTDKKEMEDLLKEAYQRAQFEIHVSHILIKCDQNEAPEDAAIAYAKAYEIRQRILNGEDFSKVARETSDDPSAKTNGGDLGYFTVFDIVYPFESAAYETEPGMISIPVRSSFGYHIIKVHERRPARGKVKVAHIMVFTPDTMTVEQLVEAGNKIYLLYDSLITGIDFSELARRQSEDIGSAAMGGELAPFGTGMMVPEFEQAALALKNPGDISKPVKTSFGWHIIKLIEHQEIGNFEEMRAEYTDMIKTSNRVLQSRLAMIEKLKKQYNFTDFNGDLSPFYDIVDSTIFDGATWSVPEDDQLNERMFIIDGHEYSQLDFARFLEANQGGYPLTKVSYLNRRMTDFIEASLMAYEESQLSIKYPEYRHLLQEYHDGILLFDLTDKMVRSKTIRDTIGLKKFFEKHRDEYIWGERLDAWIYRCESRAVAEEAVRFLKDQANLYASPSALIARLCAPRYDPSCITSTTGAYERGDNEFVDKMDWNEWISDISEKDGRFIFVIKKDILPSARKTFDEAYGLVTADYQNHLEEEWIAELRKKYRVKVNRKLLSAIR